MEKDCGAILLEMNMAIVICRINTFPAALLIVFEHLRPELMGRTQPDIVKV